MTADQHDSREALRCLPRSTYAGDNKSRENIVGFRVRDVNGRIRANQNSLVRKVLGARREAVCKRPRTSTTKNDGQPG